MSIASLICRPLVAVICFAIAVFFVVTLDIWNSVDDLVLEVQSADEPLLIRNACDLSEASGKFVGKRIAVDATVYHVFWRDRGHGEDFINVHPLPSTYCSSNSDPFITTELDLDGYFGTHSNLKSELGPFEREVDVRILGTVMRAPKPNSLIEYKIVPESIEIISSWREFTPKAAT